MATRSQSNSSDTHVQAYCYLLCLDFILVQYCWLVFQARQDTTTDRDDQANLRDRSVASNLRAGGAHDQCRPGLLREVDVLRLARGEHPQRHQAHREALRRAPARHGAHLGADSRLLHRRPHPAGAHDPRRPGAAACRRQGSQSGEVQSRQPGCGAPLGAQRSRQPGDGRSSSRGAAPRLPAPSPAMRS